MKTKLTLLLITLNILQADPVEILKTGSNEATTKVIKEKFLVENIDPSSLAKKGFTPLIGETLENWSIHNDQPKHVSYTLENGVIKGAANNLPKNSFLFTKEEYKDYLLYFEFKFDHMKGNSGVMYHSVQKSPKEMTGLQYELDNSQDGKRQWTGLLYAEQSGGWHYPNRDGKIKGLEKSTPEFMEELSRIGKETLNDDGWNAGFIRLRGNDIQTWLNGVIRTDFVFPEEAFPGKGAIALQVHAGGSCAVSWKNIYILELDKL